MAQSGQAVNWRSVWKKSDLFPEASNPDLLELLHRPAGGLTPCLEGS
ncbi:MAG: hypothetical protein H6862_04515 [Rhodospirillales bacterium]|nr:hypothetical protein [Rhodospirillales bacterium]